MLYDRDFLVALDKYKHKTIYARITSLKFDETPIASIEGRVTGGSINLDGASALRRTCSLSMTAEQFTHASYVWGLNTKFKLEIGVKNFINPAYPEIIWFNQGIYLITSFSSSSSTNNFTVSINGKDKMCLLNGEIGGSLESSVDFGTIEEENVDGIWTIRKIPIPDIIRNLVHTYAKEPYHNIIINDLDTYGLELLEYRSTTPMYLYQMSGESVYRNALLENKSTKVYLETGKDTNVFAEDFCLLEDVPDTHLQKLVSGIGCVEPLKVKIDGKIVSLAKIEYGHTAGYRKTELTYAGDLIANIGESITSVLDKIRNMLVEFEYFYDLDGRFVFQKKQSYKATMWGGTASETDQPDHEKAVMLSPTVAYTFNGGELITAFNNNPNLTNMRNDYSIWGERTGISGANIPVHMRYAIDTKPVQYTSIEVDDEDEQLKAYNEKYGTNLKGQVSITYKSAKDTYGVDQDGAIGCDWREVIYQMAKDYYKYNHLDTFEQKIIKANGSRYPTGQTGYEAYYIDLQGFWRQLYNPELGGKIAEIEKDLSYDEENKKYVGNLPDNLVKEQAELKELGLIMTELENTLKAMEEDNPDYMSTYTEYNDAKAKYQEKQADIEKLEIQINELISKLETYKDEAENFNPNTHWAYAYTESPETLNFWFDFLDTEGELQQFNVKSVGARSKAINDTNVKSIYFRDTPNVMFYNFGEEPDNQSGYIQVQAPEEMFSISAQGKSAKDKLDELIYQYGYCIETVSITAIPIYYLEPNTRIYVFDAKTGIDGEYVVSKITLPLAHGGTMSISATKAVENVI